LTKSPAGLRDWPGYDRQVNLLAARSFTSAEYHRMAESGILQPDERVELIEGEIVEMSPIGARHARCVDRLNALLVPLVTGRAIVRARGPVLLSPISEPQPDVALLAWREDFYPEAPGPSEVLLAVEVADSSLLTDRRVKVPLYGRSGVRETWLVDLVANRVEVHREPGPSGYAYARTFRGRDALAVEALPDLVVEAETLIG
jgi:hypothetical protein